MQYAYHTLESTGRVELHQTPDTYLLVLTYVLTYAYLIVRFETYYTRVVLTYMCLVLHPTHDKPCFPSWRTELENARKLL